MARVSKRQLIRKMEQLEPALAREFAKAIEGIRSQAVLSAIAELIEAGRFGEVSTALGVDSARFSMLAEKLREVFVAGAAQGAVELPVLRYGTGRRQTRIRFSFDLRNPEAEAWLSRYGGQLITGIVEDQRRLILEVIRAGLAAGQGPRDTALDLVGRIGATGRRTGGLIGLTTEQARYVLNAREALQSGEPAVMQGYFERKLRDQRFDSIVKRAIAAGQPVAAKDVEKITARYADRLLQRRGENIARTETLTAFSAAREEAFRQAIASGALLAENVEGVWGATGDGRTRHSHMALNGQRKKFGVPFVTIRGARMLFPGDTSLGAPPEETINCRCTKLYKVDHVAEAMRER